MSAQHIAPEVGRTYLMTDGTRQTVWKITSAVVVAKDGTITEAWGRTRFEREIESVLE